MLSEKKLKELMREEKQSAKFYREHGLAKIAKDESRHKRILMKKINEIERREK